ncbi:MAG: hypothetical protein MUF69_12670 [Desulfobacterota bacterium]|jgi:hypothetical protein|nr:hypothetical protein [Thermodesulfobacteriota bacterium]
MDPAFLFYLSLAAVILLLVVFGLIFLLPRLLNNLRGRGGGWNRLAEHFPADRQPPGTVFLKQTIQVGSVAYKNCATVAPAAAGLYLAVQIPLFSRLTPLLIPWESIQGQREGSLYWKKTVTLSIGSPEIGTVTLFQDLYEKIDGLRNVG